MEDVLVDRLRALDLLDLVEEVDNQDDPSLTLLRAVRRAQAQGRFGALGPARFSVYEGTSYVEAFAGGDGIAIRVTEQEASALPQGLDTGTRNDATWVRLPTTLVERRWSHSVDATWNGAHVQVVRILEDGTAVLSHTGSDAEARAHGFTGSHYDGWLRAVPAAELQVTRVETRELARPQAGARKPEAPRPPRETPAPASRPPLARRVIGLAALAHLVLVAAALTITTLAGEGSLLLPALAVWGLVALVVAVRRRRT